MIAIAILATGFGAIRWIAEMRTRSAAYLLRAFEFEMQAGGMGSAFGLPDGRWVGIWETENTRLKDAWTWRMVAKYKRLSYYPWLAVEPDPPPPQPLAHPKNALELLELPAPDDSVRASVQFADAPVWTFLWTWHPRGRIPWP